MTTPQYFFPFGQPLKKVEQIDRSRKKAFVLGVYASAVHAKWIDRHGKQIISALAVASEPTIFWTGENAEEFIPTIPNELGQLVKPTNPTLNGPSGCALDKLFLKPLGLDRTQTWLCDLLPESRVNPRQRKALDKHYTEDMVCQYNLTPANIPNFDKQELNHPSRRQEILQELETSQAETLILLGDLPVAKFLRFFVNKDHSQLSDFGDTNKTYGRPYDLMIKDRHYNVIPLCHPRQAARLGASSEKWGILHDNWVMTHGN